MARAGAANGGRTRPHAGAASSAALFALLWNALADLLGSAAAATLVRRAARRAARRDPELTEITILREDPQYRYTLPPSWNDQAADSGHALRGLFGELVPLLRDVLGDSAAVRTFVYDLAVHTAIWGATSLLVGEYTEAEMTDLSEFAVADGILRFVNRRDELSAIREVEILKLRGSTYDTGRHFFEINGDGLLEGRLERGISVLKVRGARHATDVRRMTLEAGGVEIGSPFKGLRGLLTGLPVRSGAEEP